MFILRRGVFFSFVFIFLSINLLAQESGAGDCSDGIDNDGDNLVDYYDDDCPCDGENYYGTCASACSATTFPSTNFSMAEQWRTDNSTYPFDNRQVAMVADIDADGYPDVIVKDDGAVNKLYIFDGRDGTHKLTINAPASKQFNIGIAVADVDSDGFGEIILNTTDGPNEFAYKRRLVCYEHNGSLKWVSDKQIGSEAADAKLVPGLVDFNGDGVPEVYIGDEIYNALTGAFIAAGGSSSGENSAAAGEAFSSAMDVLPDAFCANCSGLELVAGNKVYAVDISGSSMSTQVTAPVGIPDGFTAIADLDNDNDFDAVVTSGGKVYAWDLQTSTQIGATFTIGDASAATSNSPAGGVPNIGDFNGDGTIEIGLAGKNVYVVIDYNSGTNILEELWSIYVKDGSGRTGSTLFDFEGDGANEVIYKAEKNLYIIDGGTGSIKSEVVCGSGTRTDYPLVVDVDADGSTEIVCSCADASGPGNANTGYVIAFEATDRPWVHARRLWNQFQYNITNINDDLSIPRTPQKGFYVGTKFNTYLAQAPILDEFGDYVIDAAELIVEIINTDVSSCGTAQIGVTVKVTNQGNATAQAATPIAFYEENPTGLSSYIGVGYTTIALANGASETITLNLSVATQPSEFDLYAVVNSTLTSTPFSYITDFPAGPVPECDYTNNFDFVTTGCCGVSDAGEISGFEQSCSSFDPIEITSIDNGGDVCAMGNVLSNNGTTSTDRLDYNTTLPSFSGTTDPDFTFEVWVNCQDISTTTNIIFLNSSTNTEDVRFQILASETPRLKVGGINYSANSSLTIGTWQHLAVTYSSNTIKIYIDGVLDVTHNSTGTANAQSHNAVQAGKKDFGQMDNLKVYFGALSDAEILAAKNNCSYSNNGELIHWWNFDTNTGTNDAIDLVGSANLSFTGTATRSTPSGGIPGSGEVTYQWESASSIAGPWSTISSTDNATYNPGSIVATTFYRRGIVNGGSCTNSYSNVIEKRIATGLDNGGSVSGDEEGCSNFDAMEITETVAPAYSTSVEPTKTYQWQSASSASGSWANISGATSISYDPGAISSTTYFRRVVTESGCSESFNSNVIEKKVIASTFYEAGSISGEEAGCPSYTPSTIMGIDPPGSYTFIYQWQSSTDGVSFSDMPGEVNEDLSFSTNLLITTHYRRLISESGCTVYNTSNVVTKFVKTEVTSAGNLSSDESQCGTFDPAIITSSGLTGGGPTYEYIWETTDSPDNAWSTIGSATSNSYNPGAISATTYYRMGVRSVGPSCIDYNYTDPVTKEVFTSSIEENEISGDEYICGNFDPTEIVDEESPASGVEFQWESATDPSGTWSEISGATSVTYDPTTISVTTYYRRKVRETGCSGWQIPLEYVTKNLDCQCGSGAIYLTGSNTTMIATDTCGTGDWTYYYNPSNPSQLLFGIEHFPVGGNSNVVDLDITIKTTESLNGTSTYADSVFFVEDNINVEAIYVMGRSWNIELTGGTLNGAVNIRFFYDENESNQIMNLAEGWKNASGATPEPATSGLLWFKTDAVTYDPNTQLIATGRNVADETLTPAEYGFLQGIKYVQFDGVTNLNNAGGTAAVRVGQSLVLPVELVDFSGTQKNGIHKLKWSTASEENADYFIVERMDENQEFQRLSNQISALGNSFEQTDYFYDDINPIKNTNNYYRLKMVDRDGSYEYSRVLVLSNYAEDVNADDLFKVFPNPATDLLNFNYASNTTGKIEIKVTDITGRTMYHEQQSVAKNILVTGRFNLSHFIPGVYILQVVDGQTVKSKKFIVK